tara:strand:+ start:307 stop:489 length:183 start_codon:yes stop_codon:yes gene_type:complete
MSKDNLKKFIKKYNEIASTTMNEEDAGWLQGVNDLMSALRIDIKYLDKYNELNDKTKGDL